MPDEIQFTPEEQSPAVQPETNSMPQQTVDPVELTPDLAAEKEAKYGTVPQMALTGLEGAAQGALGPVASMAEKALGFKPDDITARQEVNPITHAIGEAAGFVAPASVGLGEFSQAGVLGKAGAAVSEGLGLTGAKALAAKLGVESGLYTLGDEVSKSIQGNPDSIQTALTHVGLSGALGLAGGAALGKVSDLWLSKFGPKAEEFAKDFANTLGDHSEQAYEYRLTQHSAIKNFPTAPGTPLFEKIPLDMNAELPSSAATQGSKFADKIVDAVSDTVSKGIGITAGHAIGGSVGGFAGYMFGKRAISPVVKTILPAIIKPLLDNAPSGVGLKAAIDTINSIAKGDALVSKAAKGLFLAGSKELSDLIPSKDQTAKLKDKVMSMQANPQQMLNIGGHMANYMPGHQTALAATAQNAVNLLEQARPKDSQLGPLNRVIPPSDGALAQYQRLLQIAEQPLSILSFAKNGTLKSNEVNALKQLYPGLYPNIVDKVSKEMINHISNGSHVPFKIRRSLSMLMGQPMDYNFTPQAIQSMQATHMPPVSPQQGQGAPRAKKSTAKVGKSAELAQTPSQAREQALLKA